MVGVEEEEEEGGRCMNSIDWGVSFVDGACSLPWSCV